MKEDLQSTGNKICLLPTKDGFQPAHARSCGTLIQSNDLKWRHTVMEEEEAVEGDKAFGSLPFPWRALSLASGAARSDPLPSQHSRSWQQLQWPNWRWKLGASAFQRIPSGPEIHQTDVGMTNPCCWGCYDCVWVEGKKESGRISCWSREGLPGGGCLVSSVAVDQASVIPGT